MFHCETCGACCKNVNRSELYADLDRGDGVCKYLKDNLCSIYENRPLQCRVDAYFERFLKQKMNKEDYYRLNYEACRFLQSGIK